MLGGHLDSWHSATGATDNAAGVAVAMEAGSNPQGTRPTPASDHPNRPLDRRRAGAAWLAGLRLATLRQRR